MRTIKGKRWTRFVSLLTALLVIASLVTVAAPTPAQAAHTVTVTLTPGASQTNASKNYTLTVANAVSSTHSINQVKLDVPPAGTGGSNFNMTIINNPAGWLSSFATDQFGTRVDTVTWTPGAGNEIGINQQQAFTFTATAPGVAATGLVWTVTTTDTAGVAVATTRTSNVEDTSPTLLSVGWGDTNASNTINVSDTLVFTFSEAIDQATITAANVTARLVVLAGDDYGATPTLAWNTAGTVLTLTIANAPAVAPASGDTVNPAATVTDIAGNADATIGAGPAITENTPPTLTSIAFTNVDANTGISATDTLAFTFSEAMNPATVTTANVATALPLSSGNYGVAGLAVAWSGGNTVATVTLGTGVDIASGTTVNPAATVTDVAGNADATPTGRAIMDNVNPTLTGIAFANVDTNTGISASDTLAFTFSEAITKSTITSANLATALPLSAGLYGTGAAASWNPAGTVLTVTLGTGVTIASGATVNPAVSVTDLAGNADATAGAGPAITDGVPPTLQSITWSDVDNSAGFNAGDTLAFVFSEAMNQTTVTTANVAANLPLSGGGTYGAAPAPTVAWATNGLMVIVTLGANPTIIAGTTTVNPAVGVTDLAGVGDATVGSGPTVVQVTLSLVPSSTSVIKGNTVLVSVNITSVDNFDAAAYTVTWTAGSLSYVSATAGTIGTTAIPVSATSTAAGTVTISQNVPGTTGVDGSGTLAVLNFTFTGNSGTNSNLTLSAVTLGDNMANAISANLSNTNVASPLLRGDADGNGTLNVLDITRIELIVAGAVTPAATVANTPGADADASGAFNALDITRTEILVAAAG